MPGGSNVAVEMHFAWFAEALYAEGLVLLLLLLRLLSESCSGMAESGAGACVYVDFDSGGG